MQGLRGVAAEYPDVLRGVNGMGFLAGVEIADPLKCSALARELIRRGVLVLPAFGNRCVLMVEPPIVISPEQIRAVVDAMRDACESLRECDRDG